MSFLAFLGICIGALIRAIFDAMLGRRRRSYEASLSIEASRDLVWNALNAKEIRFEGLVPVEVKVAPSSGDPEVLHGTVTVGDTAMPIAYREISSKPGEAGVIAILPEETDRRIAPGQDYYIAFTLTDESSGATRLSIRHELTHDDFLGRILIPIGVHQNVRRMQRHCEKLAGKAITSVEGRIRSALVTGVLTFASFYYLFGLQSAAVLLALLLVHEAGHAVAMRMVGQPVQGIYFIPFIGGVAVAGAPHASQAERGFVALMGPGLSLVTTALFYAMWSLSPDDTILAELVLASALLNGLNLAPVLPLDGGQIVDSILSRADPEVTAFLNFGALLAGLGASLYLEWHVLTVILMLYAPVAVMRSRSQPPANPISPSAQAWLAAAYLGMLAFYVAVAARFLG